MGEMKTIDSVDKSLCSGCGACMNVCPVNAITMTYNSEGFHEPVIDKDKCTLCGLCNKVCIVNNPKKDNDTEPDVYAVRAKKRVLKDSTSGGVFALIAEYILDKGGYVCGAAYNDKYEVWHTIENTRKGVKKIKKSKYVQSQTGLVFRKIKELLLEDKWVLFSGTPCQVAGLHNYLGKNYDKLYTMDIICHGGPAPMSWKRYLEENINLDKVKDIDFRHKGGHGFKRLYIKFTYKNGSHMIQGSNRNLYYNHFLKNLGLRKSCTSCQGAVVPRVGDFSAGDFWGAEKHYPELINSDSGLSVMFFNNAHARELLPYFEKRFDLMKKITVKEAMTKNRSNVARKMNVNRDKFFSDLNKGSFNNAVINNIKEPQNIQAENEIVTETHEEAVDMLKGKHYDVAVYGNTIGANYGGVITYYALYKALTNMNYKTVVIPPPKKSNDVSKAYAVGFFDRNAEVCDGLCAANFDVYNDIADTFVLGSDQVWNYKLFKGRKLSFYFDFIDDSKKKIAYAASYGFETPTIFPDYEDLYPEISRLMRRFDKISVREKDGVDICDNYFEVPAKHVMDPVFLIGQEEYSMLAEQAQRKHEEPYMAIYALTPGTEVNNSFQFASEKLGLPRVNMGPGNNRKWKKKSVNFDMPYEENITMEEWLYNIKNADFVITDSYHCVCFSIIFKKKFVLIQKKWAVSRIKSLLEKLGLTDRWFESFEDFSTHESILKTDIDYDAVYKILDKEVEECKNWLKEAVASEKTVTIMDKIDVKTSDITRKAAACTSAKKYFSMLKKSKQDLVVMMAANGEHIELKGIKRQIFAKENNDGYACIYDCAQRKSVYNSEPFSHVKYVADNITFAALSEGDKYKIQDKYVEFSIERDGKRKLYPCKQKGLNVLVFSKRENAIVDYAVIDKEGNVRR